MTWDWLGGVAQNPYFIRQLLVSTFRYFSATLVKVCYGATLIRLTRRQEVTTDIC
jgi:hypothetical protein